MSIASAHHGMNDQAGGFAFSPENVTQAQAIIARYPEGRQASAVLPLLALAQKQNKGWLSRSAMDHVAGVLDMPPIRVYEVATFYTMYRLQPVGEHVLEICTTTPCWLRGSDQVVEACKHKIGPEGAVRADGKFSWMEVECLGACVNAPTIQLRSDFYEDLDYDKTIALIEALERGETPKPGSAVGRHSSEPAGGATTLTDLSVGGDD